VGNIFLRIQKYLNNSILPPFRSKNRSKMKGLNQEKDEYHYHNYISNLKDAKIVDMPGMNYTRMYCLQKNTPYNAAEAWAEAFRESAQKTQNSSNFDDFFQQKVEFSDDNINLILGEITARDSLKYENLKRLYEDLFRIDNWRAQISFPQSYLKDKTWASLNDSELKIRQEIRRELKDSARDLSFPTKDLRHGLLEFKLQKQKSDMMEDTMLGGLDDIIEPQGSYNNMEADMHYTQKKT